MWGSSQGLAVRWDAAPQLCLNFNDNLSQLPTYHFARWPNILQIWMLSIPCWYGSRRSGNNPTRHPDQSTHKFQAAASRVDKCRSKEEAFANALIAVELYMNVVKLTSDVSEKSRLRNECTRLLSRAEEIKRATQWPPPIANGILLKVPLSTREITTREQIILLEGSKLHGFVFPPWKSEPEDGVFEEMQNGQSYYT
jgi:hypothetical protein